MSIRFNEIRPFFLNLNLFRYAFSFEQLILLNLVVSFTLRVFNCQHACDKIHRLKEGKLDFEGESHEYVSKQSGSYTHIQFLYYHYSRIIHLDQFSPLVNGTFGKLITDQVNQLNFGFVVLIHMFA